MTAPVVKGNRRCPITSKILVIAPEWAVNERKTLSSFPKTSSNKHTPTADSARRSTPSFQDQATDPPRRTQPGNDTLETRLLSRILSIDGHKCVGPSFLVGAITHHISPTRHNSVNACVAYSKHTSLITIVNGEVKGNPTSSKVICAVRQHRFNGLP